MSQVKIFSIVVVLLFVGIIVAVAFRVKDTTSGPGKYDQFAMCIKDSGAKFYGAFWCPHCQAQKKMFGSSAKLLPYVECSTLDGQNQLPECTVKNIESYPTWDFSDGSRLTGEVTMEKLAEKTNCTLPLDNIPAEIK